MNEDLTYTLEIRPQITEALKGIREIGEAIDKAYGKASQNLPTAVSPQRLSRAPGTVPSEWRGAAVTKPEEWKGLEKAGDALRGKDAPSNLLAGMPKTAVLKEFFASLFGPSAGIGGAGFLSGMSKQQILEEMNESLYGPKKPENIPTTGVPFSKQGGKKDEVEKTIRESAKDFKKNIEESGKKFKESVEAVSKAMEIYKGDIRTAGQRVEGEEKFKDFGEEITSGRVRKKGTGFEKLNDALGQGYKKIGDFFKSVFSKEGGGLLGALGRGLSSALEGGGKGGSGGFLKNFFGGITMGGGGGAGATAGAEGAAAGGAASSFIGASGPLGGLIAAIPIVVKAVKGLAEAPFKMISGGLNTVTGALKDMQGPLGPIGAGLGLVKGFFDAIANSLKKIPIVGEALAAIPGAIGEVVGALGDFMSAMTELSKLASPGTFKRFQIVSEDAAAVIGRTFVPVVEMMTEASRAAGDALASLLPDMGEVREALSGFRASLTELWQSLRELWEVIGPMVRGAFKESLRVVGNAIGFVVRGFALLARGLSWLMRPLRALTDALGFTSAGEGGRSSVGAAARQGQIQGFEEYQRQLQLSAIQTAPNASPEERSASYLQQIYELLTNWFSVFERVNDVADVAVNAVGGNANIVRQDAEAARNLDILRTLHAMSDPLGTRRSILGF